MPLAPRQLLMSAIFGAAFLAADPGLRADSPEKKPTEPIKEETKREDAKKDYEDLKAQLKEMNQSIIILQSKFRTYDDVILGTTDGKEMGLKRRVDDLDAKFTEILKRFDKFEDRLNKTSTSLSPTNPAPTPLGTAKLRLVNDYAIEVTLVVNGKAYRLSPSEVKTIDIPSGTYTYELLQSGSQSTTSPIKDGETVTLRIR